MAVVLMVVGVAVLIGWWLDLPILKSVTPGLVTMKANAALAFFFSGLALFLLRRKKDKTRFYLPGKIFSLFVFLIGVLSLSQYLFGWDLGIDQLLFFEDPDPLYTVYPGRMAPECGFAFTVGGLALLLIDIRIGKLIYPSQTLSLFIGFIGLTSLLGYLFGDDAIHLKEILYYTRVALHTSVAFIVFCTGLLFLRPQEGLMLPVTADDAGGLMARRLLPMAVLIPVLLGGFRWWIVSSGRSDMISEVALFVTLNMGALVISIWIGAGILHHIDTRRQKLETIRDEFVNMVSHELRTPLAAMKMALDNLEANTGGPLTERQSKTIRLINGNTDRLIRLLNNLLDLAQLESGMVRMNLRSLDPERSISEVVRTFRLGMSVGREIQLKTEIQSPHLILADDDFFSEVLVNLVNNAVRHAKGHVTIKEEEKEGALEDGQKGVEFSVIDDGPGIPPDRMKLLFQKFAQIDQKEEANDSVYRGTGLGLAICKNIVEQMGGKIWAESQVGKGSEFHFVLPEA